MWTKVENDGTKEPNISGPLRTSFVKCFTFFIRWGQQIYLRFMFGMHDWNFGGLLESLSMQFTTLFFLDGFISEMAIKHSHFRMVVNMQLST